MSEIELDQNEQINTAKADIFDTAKKVAVSDEANVKKQEEKAEETEKASEVEDKKSNKVVWQFKNRRYVFVTSIIDKLAERLPSGRQVMKTVKARNWRIPLDLDDPEDKAIHEELLKSNQSGVDFMVLKEAKKDKTDLPERAQTLERLWDMPEDQLRGMLDVAEMEQAGIIPGSNPSRTELIMAIIDIKKLSGGHA